METLLFPQTLKYTKCHAFIRNKFTSNFIYWIYSLSFMSVHAKDKCIKARDLSSHHVDTGEQT